MLQLRRSSTMRQVRPRLRAIPHYSDVTPGSAFYREILWAQQNKVVLNANGAFDAQYLVTHGELETLIEAFQARAK